MGELRRLMPDIYGTRRKGHGASSECELTLWMEQCGQPATRPGLICLAREDEIRHPLAASVAHGHIHKH